MILVASDFISPWFIIEIPLIIIFMPSLNFVLGI